MGGPVGHSVRSREFVSSGRSRHLRERSMYAAVRLQLQVQYSCCHSINLQSAAGLLNGERCSGVSRPKSCMGFVLPCTTLCRLLWLACVVGCTGLPLFDGWPCLAALRLRGARSQTPYMSECTRMEVQKYWGGGLCCGWCAEARTLASCP